MEYIGKKTSLLTKEDGVSIVILSSTEPLKRNLLLLWLFAWTICGIIVLVNYFALTDDKTKVVYMVWLAFWAYFEYKVGKAWLWRRYGKEKIRIKEGKLYLKRDISGKGRTAVYDIDFIKDLRLIDSPDTHFLTQLGRSYWVIGGETLAFDYYGKEIKFGIQLEKEESEQLMRKIKKALHRSAGEREMK